MWWPYQSEVTDEMGMFDKVLWLIIPGVEDVAIVGGGGDTTVLEGVEE